MPNFFNDESVATEIENNESVTTEIEKNESGATAIEYGLIAALVAVAIIGGVTALGSNTSVAFSNVASAMQ